MQSIGIIAGFIPALQGTLLPQLVKEGRLTLAELGQMAMAEAMGTLLAISIANAMLKPERLKWCVLTAAVAGMALDLATTRLSDFSILAVRFTHGLSAGVLLWVWVGFVTRIANLVWVLITFPSKTVPLCIVLKMRCVLRHIIDHGHLPIFNDRVSALEQPAAGSTDEAIMESYAISVVRILIMRCRGEVMHHAGRVSGRAIAIDEYERTLQG